jgi:hypothetical protein
MIVLLPYLGLAAAIGCGGAMDPQQPGSSSEESTSAAPNGAGPGATTAAADAPRPPAVVGEPGSRNRSGLELGPSFTEYAMSPQGGGGGADWGHEGGNAVIYAVRTASGGYVDNVQFAYYVPTRSDNYYAGEPIQVIGPHGGGGGSDNGWWYCPDGLPQDMTGRSGVIGIEGASGGLVDRLGVICTPDVNNPDPQSSQNTTSWQWGGGGGSWYRDPCAFGYLLDAFHIRSGSYVDNIQGYCQSAH